MLKKLLKYEFLSTGRIFGLCYAGLLGAAVLMRLLMMFSLRPESEAMEQVGMFLPWVGVAAGLSSMLYAIMVAAVFVVTFILILQRFYKNLLGGEGYLMHTLPVTPRQLIASKLVAALVWTVLSGVAVMLSVCLLFMDFDMLGTFFREWGELVQVYHTQCGTPLTLLALEVLVLLLVGLAGEVLQIYASIMVGHQAAKHKIALSVGAYVGFNMIISVVTSVLANLGFMIAPASVFERFGDWLTRAPEMGIQLVLLSFLLFCLVSAVIFWIITEHMMRKNLNLE